MFLIIVMGLSQVDVSLCNRWDGSEYDDFSIIRSGEIMFFFLFYFSFFYAWSYINNGLYSTMYRHTE